MHRRRTYQRVVLRFRRHRSTKSVEWVSVSSLVDELVDVEIDIDLFEKVRSNHLHSK